jgi:hypothetical protein
MQDNRVITGDHELCNHWHVRTVLECASNVTTRLCNTLLYHVKTLSPASERLTETARLPSDATGPGFTDRPVLRLGPDQIEIHLLSQSSIHQCGHSVALAARDHVLPSKDTGTKHRIWHHPRLRPPF